MSNPLRWFRKYEKIMLAVFGVLLMIVFTFSIGAVSLTDILTGGTSGGGGRGADDDVVAVWSDGELRESDFSDMRVGRNLLISYSQNAYQQALMRGMPSGGARTAPIPMDRSDGSLLELAVLSKQAEEMGLIVDDEGVLDYLQRFTDGRLERKEFSNLWRNTTNGQFTDQQLLQLFRRELMAMQVRGMMQSGSFPVSPLRIWDYYNRMERKVIAEVVEIPVDEYLSDVSDPTEVELNEFFEKYKFQYSFPDSPEPGFRQRQKAAFQFVKFDFEDFFDAEIANVNDTDIEKYYAENKEQFREQSFLEDDLKLDGGVPGAVDPADMTGEEQADPIEVTEAEIPDSSEESEDDESVEAGSEKPTSEEESDDLPDDEQPDAEPSDDAQPDDAQPDAEQPDDEPSDGEPSDDAPSDDAPSDAEQPDDEPSDGEPSDGDVTDESVGETPQPSPTPQPQDETGDSEPPGEGEVPAESLEDEVKVDEAVSEDEAEDDDPVSEAEAEDDNPVSEAKDEAADEAKDGTADMSAEESGDDAPSTPGEGDGDIEPAKYKSLESVRDEIKRTLALPLAREKFEQAIAKSRSLMIGYYKEHVYHNIQLKKDPTLSSPSLPDLSKIEAPTPLKIEDIPLIDELEIAEYDIGKAYDIRFTGSGYSNVFFHQVAFAKDQPPFKASLFPPSRQNESSNLTYLYWKTESKDAYEPELSEIREQVVAAWKNDRASEIAAEAAQASVAKANAAEGKSLAEALNHESFETEEISWFTGGNIPRDTSSVPRLTEIAGLESLSYDFYKKMFALSPGEAAYSLNTPKDTVYVFRVVSQSPDQSIRRAGFFQNAALLPGLQYIRRTENRIGLSQSYQDLLADHQVEWKREPRDGNR